MIRMIVTYDAQLYLNDPIDYDEMIEKVSDKRCESSGMGFGQREMSFNFQHRDEAETARNRIQILNINGLSVIIFE